MITNTYYRQLLQLLLFLLIPFRTFSAEVVTEKGLPNCIELKNNTTRVVLDPNIGGRVLVYEVKGKNILYFNPKHEGIIDGSKIARIDAGRFDFGPTAILPKRFLYFKGKWKATVTGDYSVRMVSQVDTALNVLVTRDFKLDKNSSKLICTQKLTNVGDTDKYLFCWSRTFVKGGGISLTPINPDSRYPKGHIGYENCDGETVMKYKHKHDPNVRIRKNILETLGVTRYGKFCMDGEEGWMGYISPENLLFIKKFKHYQNKEYGEMTAATTSIWQSENLIYEIEPYGPMERVKPGKSISFTEEWFLKPYLFPENMLPDLGEIRSMVKKCK
ncbi:aldose 1-epimerase [Labilibacter sediminis]|nr:aldose 1-epimerase [Labilibacter sediminis]